MLLSSDTPEGIAKSMGLGTIGFAQAYAKHRPDILLVLGDRFEMHAAAVAALPFNIPVAHIHGGELTEGAIDDALRHSITKMSHLHFVANQVYRQRVLQMGEEPWRVTVTGSPTLDNLRCTERLSAKELGARHKLRIDPLPLLVTFHSVTLEYEQTPWQVGELLAALDACEMPVVFTMPNADTNGRVAARMMEEFVDAHPSAQFVDNLGTKGYFSLMALAGAMVGNSSSGIIEAASFQLPVVNIGTRQRGRTRAENVIDVGNSRREVADAIREACSPDFRSRLEGIVNPYGDGHASERITARLKEIVLDGHLIRKKFCDWAPQGSTG